VASSYGEQARRGLFFIMERPNRSDLPDVQREEMLVAAGTPLSASRAADPDPDPASRERRHDQELLARVAAGDAPAFEDLYNRFSRPVYSLCLRALGDPGRAEDAAQDAFASIWRAASSFDRARGHPAAWILTIARNAATDAARRHVARPVAEAPDAPDPSRGPDERVVDSAQAFHVHAAVEALPAAEREVIELAYFSGLSQSEIASRLETPLGTVKTRTRTALRRLSGVLGDLR
jgi:RNA polymerase sigma-70 factor (ECF subfamily)